MSNVYFFYKDLPELLVEDNKVIGNFVEDVSMPKYSSVKSQREIDLELTIKVQQELIETLKYKLQQYEKGTPDTSLI